jgi:adenylate cyclase
MEATNQVLRFRETPRFFLRAWLDAFARRCPFVSLVLVILVSNVAGSFFNFFYNTKLIVERDLNPGQRETFWNQAAPLYNVMAYPLCMSLLVCAIWPLVTFSRRLRRGDVVDRATLQDRQRRLVNLPIVQLCLNLFGWLPGAFIFPYTIVGFSNTEEAKKIWLQFGISFFVSAVFTTVQTFFVLQAYLTAYLYPDFFKDSRPEKVPGIILIPFNFRLVMMWFAVAVMPLVALLAVALNMSRPSDMDHPDLTWFALALTFLSAASGGGIFWLVGHDLWRWMHLQTRATEQIAQGNFDIRIDQPRPDEWGRLTNHFNDMATALNQAWESHETLGQLVSPEVRDQILRRSHGFEVHLQEITVFFIDIRGFTTRCAGADPARIGALLNRFLTLALQSIEEKGGYVNKFLGDGVMALFGAAHPQPDHADLAIASARELLARLCDLNAALTIEGETPLVVGIGIHTGPALVGCFGATVHNDKGQALMRREFTAIGETVNLCQRIEQLTKKCGGPILISEPTRKHSRNGWILECVGPQDLAGSPLPMIVHKVAAG